MDLWLDKEIVEGVWLMRLCLYVVMKAAMVSQHTRTKERILR